MAEKVLNKDNFDSIIGEGVVLVDFWAEWCGPCKVMNPILEDLAKDLDGKAIIGKVNVDEQQEIARKFRIMSIPTMIIFKDGQPVDAKVGVQKKEDLAAIIDKHLGS